MAAGFFGDVRFADCVVELALERMFMEVVSGDLAGARVSADLGRRKDVLPCPFGGRPWVLSFQRLGQVGFS